MRSWPVLVVVPARDEAATIGACLRALARQRPRPGVIVVDDASTDATGLVARRTADGLGLELELLQGPGRGVGVARRLGMDRAAQRLGGHGVIATTDADTTVAPSWMETQLAALATGADAVAGDIHVDGTGLLPGVLERRALAAVGRLRRVRLHEPTAQHHHFAGASIAMTTEAYRRAGGLPPLETDEDAALAVALRSCGCRIVRSLDVRVTTAGRLEGRTPGGLAGTLRGWTEDIGREQPGGPPA